MLPQHLGSLRQRTAFHEFHTLVDDLTTVQYGYRQQINHSEANTDQREEIQKIVQPPGRRVTGKLGNIDRSADVRIETSPVNMRANMRTVNAVEAQVL